jgi:hypothetical protein
MGKQGTNPYWATLMPVFSPQPKDWNLPVPFAANGFLFYVRHEHKIKFSDSVLEAMQAEAPIITSGSLLQGSTWDGPKIFREYILENATLHFSKGKSSAKLPSAIHLSNDIKEQRQNEFLVNCGLYIEDPSSTIKSNPFAIIPNPDFNLAEAVMDSSWGTTPTTPVNFVAITGEEFYELLLPDNYGFSTTLIFPNQDLLDGDEDADSMLTLEKAILEEAEKEAKEKDKEKRRKMSYEEWIKWMEKQRKPDPWGPPGPGDPWNPDPYPNAPQPSPNPYGYPPEDDWNPKKWNYQEYEKDDLKKYAKILGKKEKDVTAEEKEWMKKLHNKWRDYERYKKFGGSSASSASQVHNK